MKLTLKKAVEGENEQELIKCLDFRKRMKIDSNQNDLLVKALREKWHKQHEDLVNTIYLDNLRDDRFVDPIVNIALNRDVYRWYDDELESTLRKCVHALKIINSEKSNAALEKLKDLKNENIMITLEMYS